MGGGHYAKWSKSEKDTVSFICGNLKIQQTSEYNKKEADSQTQGRSWWFPVGDWWGWRGNMDGRGMGGTDYWVSDRIKDVVYKMGNIASI